MSLKTFLGLIFCNLIWSAHPTMGKLVLEDFSPYEGAWLRYNLGFLSFLLPALLLLLFRSRQFRPSSFFYLPRGPKQVFLAVLLGFLTFCLSPLLQMTGLSESRAVDNALIIALEPLMTVLLAWVVLGERLLRIHYLSFAFALGGFSLLSGLTWERLTQSWDGRLFGNLILLLSLTGEAGYSVVARKVLNKTSALQAFGTALLAGALCLSLFVLPQAGFPDLSRFTAKSLLAILWLGPLGTTFCYLYWISALSKAPVASIAITLFVQPVMGSLWGVLFLGDQLTWVQASGAILILGALFTQALGELRRSV